MCARSLEEVEQAITTGRLVPVRERAVDAVAEQLTALFADVVRRRAELLAAPRDMAAGRRYVHAYTAFMHLVEELSVRVQE